MRIVAVGISYASAPLALRERLCVSGLELASVLSELRSRAREGFILSTCNRTEIYGLVDTTTGDADLLGVLTARIGLPPGEIRAACYLHSDDAAVRHALRVASGLDSMVLGEDQIQAQVKRSIAAARAAGALGPTLERLGAAALGCGKRVRTLTGVGRHAVSLESLAIRAAAERVGSLRACRVLVIGAGESASLLLRQLGSAGVEHITVVGRSAARAGAVALLVNAEPRTVADLPDALATAEVVFCCTSAPHPVLMPEHLDRRSAARRAGALLCVDLGMPRDIDVSVREMDGVTVIALDELSRMAEAHREARRSHVPAAEAIVDAEVARFREWRGARGVAAAVAAMDAHATSVAESELALALSRLPSLSPRDRAVVRELAHRIARKLTHHPIHALKQDRARTAEENVS